MPLASDVLYELGEAAFGGYVAGIIDTTVGNIHVNDAAQVGQRYLLIVSPESLTQSKRLGAPGGTLPGASFTRWDGLTATQAMLASPSTSTAAEAVSDISYPNDQGSQWYIPALDELELLYRNLKPTTAPNVTTTDTDNTFPGTSHQNGFNPSSDPQGAPYTTASPAQSSVLPAGQGFSGRYGSSTVYRQQSGLPGWYKAWVQTFSSTSDDVGLQAGLDHDANRLFRPVRRILVSDLNKPPYSPTLVSPANGVTLNRQQSNVFAWQFSDPNPHDSQSAYNFAYRPNGGTWAETGWITSALAQHTVASGTFSDGIYEWRVQAKDSQGLVSPWSVTGFFTASTVPPGPSITDPANGATIATHTYPVVWSTPNQDAYQLQVLAADGTTILYDTGQVNSTTARSREVDFPDNQTTRIIRVSVLYAGLWSPWSSATVTISYTPPHAPTLFATPVDVGAGVPSAIRVDIGDPRLRVVARNLLTNPSGEADVGWYSDNANAVWDTDIYRSGTRSRRFTVANTGNTWMGTYQFGTVSPVTAGESYTAIAHVRAGQSNNRARVYIHWMNDNGAYLSRAYSSYVLSPMDEWVELRVTGTAPSGATAAHTGALLYPLTGLFSAGDFGHADDAVFIKGAYDGPYFDGDTPSDDTYTYRWTGPEHASTSERLVYGIDGELAESTEPLVVAHDVWVRGGPEGEIRLAADLPASLPYLWHLPASGVDYEFRARAIGDNGTSSWSDWTL